MWTSLSATLDLEQRGVCVIEKSIHERKLEKIIELLGK